MRFLAAVAVASCLTLSSAFAATITVVNLDGPGEGFNDPTVAVPVGGNTGTTLGEQRLIAFQYAADIWGALLSSPVEIKIDANFDPLACDATGATLGGAGPTTVHRDFPGAPVADTWYPQALANSINGSDLDPDSDVFATFNSVIGTSCAFPNTWYYGLDESPIGSQIDFATVVLHEIGHGIGFLTLVGLTGGGKFLGRDDTYMLNLEDHSTGLSYPEMTNGERTAANKDDGDLHWTASNVVAMGASLSAGRDAVSGHVEMYAPDPVEPGSSVSHFSTSLAPDEVMEPFYTDANHDPNLALDLMFDIGWNCGNGDLDGTEACDDGNHTNGDGCSAACEVEECYNCAGEPSVCTPDTGTSCDDGESCTSSDMCQAGVCVGDATPLTGCLTGTQAGKGLLLLKDKASDNSDKLIWKLLKGEETLLADFDNPPGGTDYQLCVYDKTGGSDTVIMSLDIPGGGNWSAKSKGFKYKDKQAASDGVKIVLLKEGVAGKAKIIVKGKGAGLPMPDLSALDLPLTVQLSNGTECWESTFLSNVLKSDPEFFKAKAE